MTIADKSIHHIVVGCVVYGISLFFFTCLSIFTITSSTICLIVSCMTPRSADLCRSPSPLNHEKKAFTCNKMPYRIRKLPNRNLYKVYTPEGRSLSKKGISYKTAMKQIIAIYLSQKRRGIDDRSIFPKHSKSKSRKSRSRKSKSRKSKTRKSSSKH